MKGLGCLPDGAVAPRSAPDLFCLDFYKDFDLYQRVDLARPVKVTELRRVSVTAK
jgi:hypothetical protein